MTKFLPLDVVRFEGQTPEQRRWGNNDDANESLTVGEEYIVHEVEVHSQHTKLRLRGNSGYFNSVCFSLVGEI